MTARHRLLAVLVAALWGGNFLAIRVGLDHFPPLFLAGLRMLVIAVPALLFVPRPQVPLKWLLGYGLGFGTIQFLFLFVAMDLGMPTGLASLVLQASAPFTVLLGALFLRERLTARQAVGIGLAVLGLAAIAVSRAQSAALVPVLLTLCGALGWAFGNLCSRLAAPPKPMHLTLWMCVIPPIPLFAASVLTEGPGAGWSALGAAFSVEGLPGLAAVVYLSLMATVVGSGIWTWLMRRYPAGVVAPYSLLVPVVGIALAAAVLGERPSVTELVSAVVIVGGVLGTPRPARTTPAEVVGTDGTDSTNGTDSTGGTEEEPVVGDRRTAA
ncbi:EamA family transporter [Pseudonocardia halophobica]|uniref:EamA family transporter n=1 Tax=Pseudonocardia halophobica TaxID=29401 RepID=UPI003D94F36E